jgi:hypothetical protein
MDEGLLRRYISGVYEFASFSSGVGAADLALKNAAPRTLSQMDEEVSQRTHHPLPLFQSDQRLLVAILRMFVQSFACHPDFS